MSGETPLYYLACLQPNLDALPDQNATVFSYEQKVAWADKHSDPFYTKPMDNCLDHMKGEHVGVPEHLKIGRVTKSYVNRDGELMIVGELKPPYSTGFLQLLKEGQNIGVSGRTDYLINFHQPGLPVTDVELGHVGFTVDPDLGFHYKFDDATMTARYP